MTCPRKSDHYRNGELRALILRYLPDFCWMTMDEFVAMLEYIDEDVVYESVEATIWHMTNAGLVEKRRFSKWRKNGFQIKKARK